jgi:hypothetical protein
MAVYVVDARHLLGETKRTSGHDARFGRRRPAGVHHYSLNTDASLLKQSDQGLPGVIGANDANLGHASAQRHHIHRRVGSTAWQLAPLFKLQDRDRGLAAETRRPPNQIFVEKQIPDDQDVAASQLWNGGQKRAPFYHRSVTA